MIPNIIKGSGISGAIRYNMGEGNDKATSMRKLLGPGEVSRSEILGGQNFGFAIDSAAKVELARRLMEFNGMPENQAGRTKKCRLDCLHMSLSWAAGQKVTPDEMREAAQSALKALGMERAQAVFFAHHDTAQPHVHIVASRLDPLTGKTFSDTRDKIKAQAWGLQWERDHRQISAAREPMHRMVEAVKARDGAGLADILTERNPTFTTRDVDRALQYGGMEQAEAAKFRATMLADPTVIGLRETTEGPVMRYTTRGVLEAERNIQADARALAAGDHHGTRYATQRDAAEYHGLTREQADALQYATQPGGFAMIAGQAGTGKSRAMAAIRDTYAAEDYRVVGLAWTNSVAQDMQAKGFDHAATIASELGLQGGKDRAQAPAASWDERTVVMVDESAMLATKDLAAVTERAREAGAKLILVGDDKQLGSIEGGGIFAPLRAEHGAAEINEVQRVSQQTQRDAFTLMHKGEFRPAMELFDKAGALHWSPSAAKAEADLAATFTADAEAAPDKTRFIFAHSNAEVDRLNELARGLARDSGKLGDDHQLATAIGPQPFAVGDRVQFTGNGRSRQGKEAGFVNGATGTIDQIEIDKGKARVSMTLDSGKALSFGVGEGKGEFNAFRHGYAGTIYKGQGRTIDQTYVLVSKGWKAETSYVAMTRHRESVSVHIPKEAAADRAALAALMGRNEQRRAASGYKIDQASLTRSGLTAEAARAPTPAPTPVVNKAKGDRPAPDWRAPRNPVDKAPVTAQGGVSRETAAKIADKAGVAPQGRQTAGKADRKAKGRDVDAAGRSSGNARGRVAKPANDRAGIGFGSFGRAMKALASVLDGVGAALDSLGKPGPTPEEKIEQAKDDAASAKIEAAEVKQAAEEERLAADRQKLQAVTDRMRQMFPPELDEQRRIEREREEREGRDDGGRERGI